MKTKEYTLEQLLDLLPEMIETKEHGLSSGLLTIQKGKFPQGFQWQVMYYDEHFVNATTLKDACEEMYKWLIKKGLTNK